MKQRLHLIILLASLALSGMAQTIGEAFYIYRNDGQFNAFFRDEVDSIAYSYYDADSLLYDEVVTQMVYTADSIYRIPLAAIDSVGFVTPENVYKPGVVKLEGDIRNYIVSTDSLTVNFTLNTPNSLLPSVGDYLFTEEVSKVFPIGFIGQVTGIETNENVIAVSCRQVDFEDVFEYYYYVMDKRVSASGSKAVNDSDVKEKSWERTWSPGTFTFNLINYTTPYIYRDPLGDFSFQVSEHESISLTPTFHVKYVRIVTPRRGTEVMLTISEEDLIAEDFSLSGHLNWNTDLLSTKEIPFLELGIPFLWLYGKVGVFLNADAELGCDLHFKQTYRYTFYCGGSSRSLLDTKVSLNNVHLSSEHSGEVLIKGTVELGIFGEIGVAFMDSRIASVAYRGEVGIGIEGNVMLYKKDAEEALHSTDVYKTLQGNDIQLKWFYRTGLPVKLLWLSWPNEHKPHNNVFARVSLVPNFSDTKLERDKDDSKTLFASTKASGACLPVDLGFTLFEQQSTNSVPTSYSRYGYVGMNADMYASFYNMPTSKKYEVFPTVKLLGVEMLAEPKAEEEDPPLCPDDNHPHMIDLGLPSGTKWACCNIGAVSPDARGGEYAWGETEEKSSYSANNYKFAVPSENGYIRIDGILYNFIFIGENICSTTYDVAHAKWGGAWRMPTNVELQELCDNCSWNLETVSGVYGYRVTGNNGSSIFLPGYYLRYWSGVLDHAGSYWGGGFEPIPYILWSDPNPHVHSPVSQDNWLGYFTGPYQGCNVRAVCDSTLLEQNATDSSSYAREMPAQSGSKHAGYVIEITEDTQSQERKAYMRIVRKEE